MCIIMTSDERNGDSIFLFNNPVIDGPTHKRPVMRKAFPFQCVIMDWSKMSSWHRHTFCHDDVIKWKHFPRYWPFVRGRGGGLCSGPDQRKHQSSTSLAFVRGIHRSPVNSPHKGQRRGALMFSFNWARINGWVNNREAGDFRRRRLHYDVIVMYCWPFVHSPVTLKLGDN